MTGQEIQDRVLAIVATGARVDPSTLTLDTALKDLHIESLGMVQLLFEIEDAFDVYIPQDDRRFRLSTIGEVVDGVKALIAARQEHT